MRHARVWITVGVLLGPALSSGALAQSLADVARAEEARRKSVPKAVKVYTNSDLQPDQRSRQAQPVPSVPMGVSRAAEAPPETTPPPESEDPRKDEPYWRNRITAAREQLQRHQLFAEALQSRINALTTDFVNRDDPAQRAVIGQERLKALNELERVKKETEGFTKAIADIEEEARRAGVPPGWLR